MISRAIYNFMISFLNESIQRVLSTSYHVLSHDKYFLEFQFHTYIVTFNLSLTLEIICSAVFRTRGLHQRSAG